MSNAIHHLSLPHSLEPSTCKFLCSNCESAVLEMLKMIKLLRELIKQVKKRALFQRIMKVVSIFFTIIA